jgi:hypothetical protein
MEPATHPDRQKRHDRVILAQALMRLFDLWGLGAADRLTLLGLSGENRTALQRYAGGEPLAASRDLLDRAGHLLGIHKSLKLLFPRNEDIVRGWMASRNTRFGGETPIEIVRQYGLPGLVMVRGTLDVMRGH